ncbi:hypothetical protein DRO26_00585 [Candidatus Bathyarchaeota archaeon]|nr:MAG: hypothetical protein DRO26_00585 [Candidatus Bathyarchaeota archaeon]
MFSPDVRLVRSFLIDYLSEQDISLRQIFEVIKGEISQKQLSLDDVLKIIDKVEEDPLSVPYVPRVEKLKKLNQLRKLLKCLEDLEKEA